MLFKLMYHFKMLMDSRKISSSYAVADGDPTK